MLSEKSDPPREANNQKPSRKKTYLKPEVLFLGNVNSITEQETSLPINPWY